jgi:hypothetical protein
MARQSAAHPDFRQFLRDNKLHLHGVSVPKEGETGHVIQVECGEWQLGSVEAGSGQQQRALGWLHGSARAWLWLRPYPANSRGFKSVIILPYTAAGSSMFVTGTDFERMTSKRMHKKYTTSCWVVHPVTGKRVCKVYDFITAVYGERRLCEHQAQ